MKAIYWVAGVSIIAIGIFISIVLGDAQKTVPKIKLSYFTNEQEIAESILKRLDQEIGQNKSFWVGVEPDKKDHLDVAEKIRQQIVIKNGPFDEVIADSELRLDDEQLKALQVTQVVPLKNDLIKTGELLSGLEKQNKKYFFLTASIYSTSFIKDNQIHSLKEKFQINPMTISIGYYSATPEEESDEQFRCDTEDKSGTSNWGCAVLNKARGTRRRFEFNIKKPWSGVMDLTGEKDYILLLRRK